MKNLLRIGLEIHAQILSKSKLFARSASVYWIDRPNQYVSLFDIAIPGTLPTLNKFCVEQAIKLGLALNGQINRISEFERKHYFYCDLPLGYQITQQKHPIISKATLETIIPNKSNTSIPLYTKTFYIDRIQLEQDSGKSITDISPNNTYVDYNRANIGLLEIVTTPCFNTTLEVTAFLKSLQQILRCLNVCNGNMEEGSLRCDINVSVHKPIINNNNNNKEIEYEKSNRVEIKNLNSFKNIEKAINYEYKRQNELIKSNMKINQETRKWNTIKNITEIMRNKETQVDYRFMSDPDLPLLHISNEWINEIKSKLPELPNQTYNRFLKQYKISPEQVLILLDNESAISLYEELAKKYDSSFLSSFITTDYIGKLRLSDMTINTSTISKKDLCEIIDLIIDNKISRLNGKHIIEKMLKGDKRNPLQIVKDENMIQVSDISSINEIIIKIISENPKEVESYKSGNKRVFKYFMGEIMKESKGKLDPKLCSKELKKQLDS